MPLTPEQRALRRKGLGGSEIAAVAGIHPYLTRFEVYLDKVGLREDNENRYQEWGHRLEPVIGQAYADRAKLDDAPLVAGTTLVSSSESWILGTPDFLVCDVPEPRGVECKARGAYDAHRWGPDGTDEVPDEVAAQCHWGMMVTGMERWDVAVLIGGNDFRVYTLRYDKSIADSLRQLGHEFWHGNVLAETPPQLDASKSAQEFVKRIFQVHDDALIEATPAHDALCNELKMARRRLAQAKRDCDLWSARVKAAIAHHAGILGRDYKVTWKRSRPGTAVNWEMIADGLLRQLPESQRRVLVSVHSRTVPGSRRFLPTFSGEKDDAHSPADHSGHEA